uniref:RBR-type E3 ubiquitin transferase n=1 Tax=Amblyomma aureolatum TaxID=187763 RepID=A0A1E1XD30_9ACAR
MANEEEQENELLVLESIYDSSVFEVKKLGRYPEGHFLVRVEVPKPFHVLVPRVNAPDEMQEILLEHLPPVQLDFELPPSYPSDRAPKICLSCPWLTMKELEKLCQALDNCWWQDPHAVVLYRWMTLLETEAGDILGLTSSHSLAPLFKELAHLRGNFRAARWKRCLTYRGYKRYDARCFKEMMDPRSLATLLTEFNSKEKRRLFNLQWIACQVCLSTKLGSEFELVLGCDHAFCRECLREHFRIQIESGSASQLRCPQEKCTTQVLPTQVKSLVGDALGSRYEESLLNAYLDSQADLTYCPRLQCQRPVVTDPDLPMAQCASCYFVFCLYCRMVYHGVQPCRLKPGEQRAIRDEYLSATPAAKQAMEKRYGRRTLQLLVDESLTQDWMQENSKKCPHCGISIEKQDGCNKMTCWRCGTYFCWICLVSLKASGNPYQHFSDPRSSCFNKLFEGAEELADDDHELGEFL